MYTCSENSHKRTVGQVGRKELILTTCSFDGSCVRVLGPGRKVGWGNQSIAWPEQTHSLRLRMVFYAGKNLDDCHANPIKALGKQYYSCTEDIDRERGILETSRA